MHCELRSRGITAAAEARVRALAAANLAVLERRQLRDAGLSNQQIDDRISSGRYRPLHRGVLLVDSPVPPPGSRELAAIRAAGPRVAVSGASAGTLMAWRLGPALERRARETVELSTATGRTTERDGIRLRRVGALTAAEVRMIGPIPVTTPARTLVDLSPLLDARRLERLISEAYVANTMTRTELVAQLERSRHRPGVGKLRAALAADPVLTDSEAERLLDDALRDAGLPRPRFGATVLGYRIDALWPTHRLVAEVNGFATHGQRRRTFERDHEKTQALQAAGYEIFPITYAQLTATRTRTIARLAAVLAARSSTRS